MAYNSLSRPYRPHTAAFKSVRANLEQRSTNESSAEKRFIKSTLVKAENGIREGGRGAPTFLQTGTQIKDIKKVPPQDRPAEFLNMPTPIIRFYYPCHASYVLEKFKNATMLPILFLTS